MPGLHETRLKHKETFLILKRGKVSYTTVVNGANTLIFSENVQHCLRQQSHVQYKV